MRAAYDWTLRGVMRHRFLTMLAAAGTLAATVYLFGLVPKGFIPNQDTGQIYGQHRRRRRTSRSTPWCGSSSGWRRLLQANPNIERCRPAWAPADTALPETGAHLHPPETARAKRKLTPGADHRRAAAQAECDPGHPHLLAESAADPHRRPGEQEPVSVHAAGAGHCRSSIALPRHSKDGCAASRA